MVHRQAVEAGGCAKIPGVRRTTTGEEVGSRCIEIDVTMTDAADWGGCRREEGNRMIQKNV